MDLAGEGIKEASKLFQQAAWTFEHLRTLVTNLAPSEVTVDFTSEALGMLSNLMLAQAQYLFYKKAMDAGMKAPVLAKIAMQVADYFAKAYDLSQTNQGLKAYDSSRFSNIMHYHSLYFAAMAYSVLSVEEYKTATDKSAGMGRVVALLKKTVAELDRAKPVVATIPSNYQDNFNAKYADVCKLRDKALNDNKTIYFERETPQEQLPKPDLQNFVKLEPLLGDILQGKLGIEEKLRHIVPPQVQAMQLEMKKKLQEVIDAQFAQEQRADAEQKRLLAQYGLPQALHAATSTTEIPPQLWEKIEDFQKKGGHSNVQGMIAGLAGIRDNNFQMIADMNRLLDEEEAQDGQLRQTHGGKWSRMPSNALNVNLKNQLFEYQLKLQAAAETDKKVEEKFATHGDTLKLLNKTRNELAAMIPQSQDQKEISSNPAILA